MARRFQPTFWATLVMAFAVMVLIGLGTWQVQRLGWKTDLLARIDKQMTQEAVALPSSMEDTAEWEFRRVAATGRFLHDKTFFLQPRTFMDNGLQRGQAGFHAVTPLEREDGEVLLINRGWVDAAHKGDMANPNGQVTVTGIARMPERQGRFTPGNKPFEDVWFWLDMDAVQNRHKIENLSPLVLYADRMAEKDVYPVGGQLRIKLPNDHLQYAMFWYFMAFVLFVIYILYHMKPVDDGKRNEGL